MRFRWEYESHNTSFCYEGEISSETEMMHGKGVLIKKPEGINRYERYEGDFYDGEATGNGIIEWRGGETKDDIRLRYEGEVKNMKMHGKGSLYYSNGKVFKGVFKDGEFDDVGQLFDAKGKKGLGGAFWSPGVFTTSFYRNGERYEGEVYLYV